MRNVTFGSLDRSNSVSSVSQTLWLTQSEGGGFTYSSVIDPTNLQNGNDSIPNNNTLLISSACHYDSTVVEAEIMCNISETACEVDRVRPNKALSALAQTNLTLDMTFSDSDNSVLQNFINTSPESSTGVPTLIESYITDPLDLFNGSGTQTQDYLDQELDVGDFTANLALLLNTFYQSGRGPSAYINDPMVPGFDDDFNIAANGIAQNVTAAYLNYSDIVAISPAWLTVFLFADVVLLVFALADIIWEARTISPDFLGFASSVVRSNKSLKKKLLGDTALSGVEKARALASKVVMLQDVKATSEVGKIVLGEATDMSKRLERGRMYR